MSDDSRSSPASTSSAPNQPAGQSWIERLLERIGLRQQTTSREDIADALEETSGGPTDLSMHERAMLRNVLALSQTRVFDVMIPRADIVCISQEATLGELLAVFRTAGHSRLPVHGETLDDPRGMVHIRDFLDYLAAKAEAAAKARKRKKSIDQGTDLGAVDLTAPLASARILRPVLYVPPSMPAMDLLLRMQSTRTHMALVIDEYGGTDGLVSIEDLVEVVMGDIEDEHDQEEGPVIQAAGENRFNADGRATLEELREATGIDLSEAASAEGVETIGGLIVTLAGRVPGRGELVAGPGAVEFEVIDADPRRVKRLRVHLAGRAASQQAAKIATEQGSGDETRNGMTA
jgi:CBS domain containing-hemolysin-like protein